jgi:hypothetical protein
MHKDTYKILIDIYILEKMEDKKVRQCCKNSLEIWFNFRYTSLELFLDKPIKFILLVDEGNEREVIQLINIR